MLFSLAELEVLQMSQYFKWDGASKEVLSISLVER